MTQLFDTPKVRTISTWRQTPWQISWAVNIRNATVVLLGVLKDRVHAAEVCPLAVFAYDTDQVADAPALSAMSGNNAWGMVPSSWYVPGDFDNHGRYHFYFPPCTPVVSDEDLPNSIPAGR